MSNLNYKFFDAFKMLDKLCRDIYGSTPDNKLGVTLYLEDMEQHDYQGALKVTNWTSDYNYLKKVRNIRNKIAHSDGPLPYNICTEEDLDFVESFRERILNQTDPLARLRKQMTQMRRSSTTQPTTRNAKRQTNYTPRQESVGCLGLVLSALVVIACVVAYLI